MDIINQFESVVVSFIKNYADESALLIAVSGGADSMALLASLRASDKRPLFCVHVEHGLRSAQESRGDADFVRDFCKSNEIECRVIHIPPGRIEQFAKSKGIGIEAAARFFRHRSLLREAKNIKKNGHKTFILLAHTKDDLLETALIRILRGAGPAGLRAMPEKRGCLLRPLLTAARVDVIGYLNAKNIPWREDSTNTDDKFLRNRIRRRLVPILNESFPEWKKGITGMAETQSLVTDFITSETTKHIVWTINSKPQSNVMKRSNSSVFIFSDEENFFVQPEIIREEAIFQGIDIILSGIKYVSKSAKRSVIRQFCSGALKAADLGPVRINREKGKILLSSTQKEFFESGVSQLIKE
ncbi:MAG: tRNA lysidine(34) synthetase TilS [Treponema sp.]|nr:tRNA lysidine(34) synthetase TilS [Treponema sp.]